MGSLDKNELLESILGLLAHAKTETSQRHIHLCQSEC